MNRGSKRKSKNSSTRSKEANRKYKRSKNLNRKSSSRFVIKRRKKNVRFKSSVVRAKSERSSVSLSSYPKLRRKRSECEKPKSRSAKKRKKGRLSNMSKSKFEDSSTANAYRSWNKTRKCPF